ncbi:MAG TPA: hypothetical protein VKU77_26955 [Streptosporangiaceae bacterium]|nr:hypothetical protein [Streptosporangiaceae bacterium]
METMILVAGLAVAGLAGIAAAFYFSMRPRGARVRAAGPDRAADSRVPAGRSRTSPPSSGRSDRSASPVRSVRPDRPDRPAASTRRAADRAGASTVIDLTGPQPILDDAEPVVAGRRARHSDRHLAEARQAAEARHEDDIDDPGKTTRSRRRVGWRKGSDVDEEMWPAEGFGGVSDEQFWDDLAADKPLATTARAAAPETAAPRRPPNSGPLPDLYPVDSRSREASRRAEGAGTHPQPRLGPDDRTSVQPAIQSATPPSATAPLATQPYPVATQPSSAAMPPARSRAISPDEDPLTSPRFSLRAKGSVDGRSRRPDPGREHYDSGVAPETQAFSLADTRSASGGYPDGVPPFRQFDRPAHGSNGRGRSDGYRTDPLRTDPLRSDPLRSDPLRSDHLRAEPLRPGDGYGGTGAYPYPQSQPYGEPTSSASTPPYGERYGYGVPVGQPGPASQPRPADGPRPANGSWSPGPAGVTGSIDGGWAPRPAYPPVNGHRGPYDLRGYDRRLTPFR